MRSADLPCLALAACVLLVGCNDTLNLAPPTSDTPWQIPASEAPALQAAAEGPTLAGGSPLALHAPPEINPTHVYSLVELIDIAERRNETTRIAWEQARQAAINVGIARAAYLPSLTASAIGGYQHIALPFPSNFVPRGYITAQTEEFLPELAIRYLLFDFGSREATVEAARQLSLAADITFTDAHQRLIFNVARAYFSLDGADAQLRAARQALADAQAVQQSAEAMYGRGLATIVAVQLARRDTAQAQYNLAQATTAQHDATYGLLAAMELPPTTQLHVADSSDRPLPERTRSAVQEVLRDALRQRPDLLAEVARLRATDANIALARSAFYPKVSVSANVLPNIGQISVDGAPYLGIKQPQGGIFLHFDWPLYQGGLLENQLRSAQSQHAAAEDALQERRNQALREVALAYDQLDTGLQQYSAAVALRTAADAAFSSASDAFAHGVGTITDAVSAETALAAARAAVAQAHAQSLINAAALAFATGSLTSSAAFNPAVPPGR